MIAHIIESYTSIGWIVSSVLYLNKAIKENKQKLEEKKKHPMLLPVLLRLCALLLCPSMSLPTLNFLLIPGVIIKLFYDIGMCS